MAIAYTTNLSTGVTIPWTVYEGQLEVVQPIGDYYNRVGSTGEGSQTLGNLGPDCEIEAHYVATTAAQALAVRDSILGQQTQYLRVQEPDGTIYQRVLLKVARARRRRSSAAYGGVTYPYRVVAMLTMAVQS